MKIRLNGSDQSFSDLKLKIERKTHSASVLCKAPYIYIYILD
jgi:hypothetical protein